MLARDWTTASGMTADSMLANCKAAMDRARALKAESDSRAFVFEGSIAEFRAEMDRQGIATSAGSLSWPAGDLLSDLEVREFDGKVYVGTADALKRALPFLYPIPMPRYRGGESI